MHLQIYENYNLLSKKVAKHIIKIVKEKPDAIICLGSGDTPLGVFEHLVDFYQNGEVDFSKTHFVGLDEWVGMDKNDEGSCFFTMYKQLFDPLQIRPDQIHCFNAKSNDLVAECQIIDDLIDQNNGLDFLLLGIGLNGHLAMNEPGTSFQIGCHISKLAESTISTGQKYFKSNTPLELGITIGLRHVSASKNVVLMANGIKKAEIIAKTFHSDPNEALPSSILNSHKNAFLMVDKEAGSHIEN
jgi:glucosamine-6-phosphate isomerase